MQAAFFAPKTSSPAQAESKPSFYARPTFIRAQRIGALALMTLGLFSCVLAPVTHGATAAIASPLLFLGSAVLGASLIQQVIGHAPNCEHGRIKRAVAGALMIGFGPIGIIPGAVLWYLSNEDNKRAARAA